MLLQTGRKRDERLPQLPTLYELMDPYKTAETERRLAEVVLASNIFGRPYVVPPGISSERLRMIRDAFGRTTADRGFLAEAKNAIWR